MERLTFIEQYEGARVVGLVNDSPEKNESFAACLNAINRLAAYEDTGLSPEEITALQAENAALTERLEKCVELPCKVGDTVYYVDCFIPKKRCEHCGSYINDKPYFSVKDGEVIKIEMDTNSEILFTVETDMGDWFNTRTLHEIFTTELAAKKRLKELEEKI